MGTSNFVKVPNEDFQIRDILTYADITSNLMLRGFHLTPAAGT
jgi:hypothetical protein